MYSSLLFVSCLAYLGSVSPADPIPNLLDPNSLIETLDQYLDNIEDADILFNLVKELFGKKYVSVEEELHRIEVFKKNLEHIKAHNNRFENGASSFKMGINQFFDMETSEVVNERMGFIIPKDETVSASNVVKRHASNNSYPSSVDWRDKGYVNPVRDQGNCGSCWAFSAICALEGQHFKKTGNLVSLSEQQLVDCSSRFHNGGCNGGAQAYAFKYIAANDGVNTNASYPYQAKEKRNCAFNNATVAATCTGYKSVSQSEKALMVAVATVGPISVAINSTLWSFQSYRSGIYDDPTCNTTPDHAVTIVGYGTSPEGKDFWIARNCWGEYWGDKGYIYIARNKNNLCGVASWATYPVL